MRTIKLCPLCGKPMVDDFDNYPMCPNEQCALGCLPLIELKWVRLARQVAKLRKDTLRKYADEIERLIQIEPLKSDAAMSGKLHAMAVTMGCKKWVAP